MRAAVCAVAFAGLIGLGACATRDYAETGMATAAAETPPPAPAYTPPPPAPEPAPLPPPPPAADVRAGERG